MRIAIAAATVLVSATALLVPSINSAASARDVENGISELSARRGVAFGNGVGIGRGHGFRGTTMPTRTRRDTTGVGIPSGTSIAKPPSIMTTPR